jgi:hypothetical protein
VGSTKRWTMKADGQGNLLAGSAQHALIQQIRRRYNQEAVQGRTVEDEQAIRHLVE